MSRVPERIIGVWRGSKASFHFWAQTILTLSLYYWFVYRYNDVTLTTDSIIQRRGSLLSSSQSTLILDSITDVSVRMSFIGSIFRYGDIQILTSGSRQAEIWVPRLSHPETLRDAIFKVRDGNHQAASQIAQRGGQPSSPLFGILVLVVVAVVVLMVLILAYFLIFARR